MGGRQVTAMDGSRWRVRRRWLDRPLPDVRRRFDTYREKTENLGNVFDGAFAIDAVDSPWAAVAIVVVAVLLVFVLLPLLGVALELIVLIALASSGIVGRIVLRRPWTVEAINLDDEERTAAYAVKGWRRSGEAAEEIASAIEASCPPDRISEGVRL